MTFKVGDRVRLTGSKWDHKGGMNRGAVLTVRDTDEPNYVLFQGSHDWVKLDEGWEVELIANEEHLTPESRNIRIIGDSVSFHGEPGETTFALSVHRVTGKIADLLIAKNKAYGDSALNPVRIFSKASRIEQLNVRIDDKISRIQRGTDFGDEDTVRDLIGYLVLRLIAEESE